LLVPCSPYRFQIGGTENPKPTQKYRFLCRDDTVNPRHGRLEKAGGLPVLEHDIQWTAMRDRSDPTDDRIVLEVEKDKRGPKLATGAGREWELANENLAEHAQRKES
jgi:hypothetical protein